jgi:putative ATPase
MSSNYRKSIDEVPLFRPPKAAIPLAERVRPMKLTDVIGQEHLLGKNGVISKMVKSGNLSPMIFWGPPGTGKTTISRLLADEIKANFIQINAISSGVKELREIIKEAEESFRFGKKTVLFIDEIHRFNKAQQAALLKSVEEGTIVLIGATTENPSFEVISPLLSRSQVYVLNQLSEDDLETILANAISQDKVITGVALSNEAKKELIRFCGGDARILLNAFELSYNLCRAEDKTKIDIDIVKKAYQREHLLYDKKGEEHYNTISAYIKSIRGSDPDAAVYYLARMLEAGEDPKFIARRLIILASEDIGNAEPYALTLATSCFSAVDYIGMPEASLVLAQTSTYLASCPKSNSSTIAISQATREVKNRPNLPIPLHLRNAPTNLMKDLDYGKDYKYSHDFEQHISDQQYLPEELKNKVFYQPTELGREANIKKYLDKVRIKRKKNEKNKN